MVKYDGASGCLLCSVCYVHNELWLQDVIYRYDVSKHEVMLVWAEREAACFSLLW